MTKRTWPKKVPTAWQAYIQQPDEVRETQYQVWCNRHGRDPDLQESADEFVFAIPNSAVDTETDTELEASEQDHG